MDPGAKLGLVGRGDKGRAVVNSNFSREATFYRQ
jgi:hypothetical protein